MADVGVQFINTPFAYEPYQAEVGMSISGCIFTQVVELPDSILVQILDMQGDPVPECPPLDINAGVVFHNMNPILFPGLPAMYYAFPRVPKTPGTYQVRVTIRYPSGPISPRMKTFQVFDKTGQATQRAADMPGTDFNLTFEQPRANAKVSPIRPLVITCTTKKTRRSAYGYFLVIEDSTNRIVSTGFHRTWILRDHDCQMTAVLRMPATASGGHSIVAYLLEMNQGQIIESRTQLVQVQLVAAPSPATSGKGPKPPRESPVVHFVPDLRINLNTATAVELTAVPGIGTTLAKRIIARRPFKAIDELAAVERFPESRLAEMVHFVTTGDA